MDLCKAQAGQRQEAEGGTERFTPQIWSSNLWQGLTPVPD